MRARNRLVALGLVVSASIGVSSAQPARSKSGVAGFPVPRVMDEFRNSICAAMSTAKELNGDKTKFLALALPYAPLDLNMDETRNPGECHSLKEYAYGYFATAAGLSGAAAQAGLNEFLGHYGRLQGKADFVAKAADLKGLRDLVAGVAGIQVISQWNDTDYRVNNVISTEAGFREYKPSATMGFFTSCQGMTAFDRAKVPGLKSIPDAKVAEILGLMRKLGVRAVVKQAKWTRLIQAGVADKEAGMLFPAAGQTAPPTTTHLSDGKKILVIEKVAEDSFYYLTT